MALLLGDLCRADGSSVLARTSHQRVSYEAIAEITAGFAEVVNRRFVKLFSDSATRAEHRNRLTELRQSGQCLRCVFADQVIDRFLELAVGHGEEPLPKHNHSLLVEGGWAVNPAKAFDLLFKKFFGHAWSFSFEKSRTVDGADVDVAVPVSRSSQSRQPAMKVEKCLMNLDSVVLRVR